MSVLFIQQLRIRALVRRLKVHQDSLAVCIDEEIVFVDVAMQDAQLVQLAQTVLARSKVFGLGGSRTAHLLNQEADDSPVLVDVTEKRGGYTPAVDPLIRSCLGGKVGNLPGELSELCEYGFLEVGVRHAVDCLADAIKLFELEMIYHGVVPDIADAWKTAPPGLAEERLPRVAVFTDTAFVPVTWRKDGELREENGFVCAVLRWDETAV